MGCKERFCTDFAFIGYIFKYGAGNRHSVKGCGTATYFVKYNIPGAMVGGILLGIIETLGKAYVSAELGDAFVFAVLIIVLLVKPTGLMGKKIHEKV